jgi:glycosyltransferase involved in cell wall biosynthesis
MARTVTLITTVYNEEASVGALLDSILAQTYRPDEFIIVDAGSTDRTAEIISEYIARGLSARLIVEAGASRARGRNLAIQHAKGEVIASIDAGCTAEPTWLAELLARFEEEDPPEVVGGYYLPEAQMRLQRAIAAATVPPLSEVDAISFLPSSRSVAFTRAAWRRVGGYPEYMEYAEDTLFDLRLKQTGPRFRFQPSALVRWRMVPTLGGVYRQFRNYATSDGELGNWFIHYQKAFVLLALVLALLLLTLLRGWFALGFLVIGGLYWWRYFARARQRGADVPAAQLAPLVNLIVDAAHLVGYAVGRARRRPVHAALPAERRLSVAQITYTYQPIAGGADVYVQQLADMIVAAGHHHVVYQRRAATDAPGVRFIPNPLRGRPLEFWTQAFGLFRLWRELMTYDVVICHYPPYLLAIYLMNLLTRGPVRVGISHGVFWDDAPKALHSRLKARLTRWAFRRAHLYVANDTHFLRAMGLRLRPKHRLHAEVAPGVWFIPNGVDPEQFQPVAPMPELRELNPILVPRNLFRNRGIHLAVEAFDLFHQEYPDTHLLIVGGGGQPDYVAEVQRDIARRGLEEAVRFHGAVPHADQPAIYSSARLTLIPSLCGEGTSLSALESMACGTVTVCTDVAGLKDLPGPHAAPDAASLADVMRQVYVRRLATADEQRRIVLTYYSLARWRRSWQTALAASGVPLVPPRQASLPMEES